MTMEMGGLASEARVEKLFAEEDHLPLWARAFGRWAFCAEQAAQGTAAKRPFRARAATMAVLTGRQEPVFGLNYFEAPAASTAEAERLLLTMMEELLRR